MGPSDQFDLERLLQLVGDKCNGTLTPEGREELDSLLAASAKARATYSEAIAVHVDLHWDLAGKEASNEAVARFILEDADRVRRYPVRPLISRAFVWFAAMAACILVGTFVFWRLKPADDARTTVAAAEAGSELPGELPVLGHLSSLLPESSWSFGRSGDRNSTEFRCGDTILLDRGAAELRLTTDIVAVLEAPVVLHVMSVDHVRVLRGRIKVDVPKGREGFIVETAVAEVIDLGTSFFIEVSNHNTDVVVLHGAVDLKVADQSGAGADRASVPAKRFRMGEAVRVNNDGTLSRIVNVQQTLLRQSRVDTPARRPIITSVKDNIVRDDVWSFYEVVWGGMREDARAFVDRRHEWNGETESGMPAYLVGGDYVKTFNNDKVTDDLTIDVELSQSAILYVLLDNRVIPPDWLVELFEDTGDEIGVDEAFHDPENFTPGLEDFAGVGPGVSIERSHSIWQLVVREPGVVTLGANGRPVDWDGKWLGTRAGINMYGIVAVPLGEEI